MGVNGRYVNISWRPVNLCHRPWQAIHWVYSINVAWQLWCTNRTNTGVSCTAVPRNTGAKHVRASSLSSCVADHQCRLCKMGRVIVFDRKIHENTQPHVYFMFPKNNSAWNELIDIFRDRYWMQANKLYTRGHLKDSAMTNKRMWPYNYMWNIDPVPWFL